MEILDFIYKATSDINDSNHLNESGKWDTAKSFKNKQANKQ